MTGSSATSKAPQAPIFNRVAVSLYGANAETPPASQRVPPRMKLSPLPAENANPAKRRFSAARPNARGHQAPPRLSLGQAARGAIVLLIVLAAIPSIEEPNAAAPTTPTTGQSMRRD
ncbi:MAG: hypothetical protein N2444_06380 [Methylocystis sp.]|nr:hypothetical protein [Methylocystis sp.]